MSKFQVSAEQIEVMACHYITAALWTEQDELGDCDNVSSAAKTDANAECADFCAKAGDLIEQVMNAEGYGSHPDCGTVHPAFGAMGHDLWLTRNGHGCGFWDRDELKDVEFAEGGNLGDALADVARKMGESYVYLGGDGFIYLD